MPDKAPHLLTDLNIEEASIVDRGANKGAKVILLKSQNSECDKMESKERNQFVATLMKYMQADIKEVGAMLKSDFKTGSEDEPLSEELKALQKSVALQAAGMLVLTCKNLFGEAMAIAVDSIAKAKDAAGVDAAITAATTAVSTLKTETKIDDDTLIKSFNDKIDSDLGERAKAKKKELDGQTTDEEMKKFRENLPTALHKAFDDMPAKDKADFMKSYSKSDDDPIAKALATTATENASLKKRLDKMEGEQDIAKAKIEFNDLDGKVDMEKFIKSVITLRKADKDAANVMIEQTRAMAKQAETSNLFSIVGKNGQGASDAEGKIDAAVKKHMIDHPDDTEAVAMTKVLDKNPELYGAHVDEQAAG